MVLHNIYGRHQLRAAMTIGHILVYSVMRLSRRLERGRGGFADLYLDLRHTSNGRFCERNSYTISTSLLLEAFRFTKQVIQQIVD